MATYEVKSSNVNSCDTMSEEKSSKGHFHEKLVRAIQDVGQEIIDNAEEYAGTSPYLSRMTITIDFDPEVGPGGMLTPEINVDKTYLCGTICERLKKESGL